MQGIYASPARELSARAIFDGRKSGRRRLAAPAGGMGQFISRLHERLADRGVRFSFNTAIDRLDPAIATVIATAAASAAPLLAPHAPALAARISAIRVAPLVTVTMFFAPHFDDVHGFGVLFPRASGVRALGALFNTDIFAGRGPARSETWIVGDRDVGMTDWTDDRLLRRAVGRPTDPDRAPRHAARGPRHAMAAGDSRLRPHDRRAEEGSFLRYRPGSPSRATIWERLALALCSPGRIGRDPSCHVNCLCCNELAVNLAAIRLRYDRLDDNRREHTWWLQRFSAAHFSWRS